MTWVGPRPLLPQYLPHFNGLQRRRLLVKPGITGLAQVQAFKKELSWEERFELDAQYVKDQSVVLAIKLLLSTFWYSLTKSRFGTNHHERLF